MNSSKGDTTNLSKDNQNPQTKTSSDTNKHSDLNSKEVSKTSKEVKKLTFNQLTRSLIRKPTPHNSKLSNANENIKMFKNYFESKLNKTIKKLNQTMNQKLEMHSLPMTAAKPSENNSILDKSSVPFSHRPVDSVEITLHKKHNKLINKKEPTTSKTQKHENKILKTGNKDKIQGNIKTNEHINLTEDNNVKNKKAHETKSEANNLKQAIKNVNCINKIKKALNNRNSYKTEKTNENTHKKILESIKETKISNQTMKPSRSFRKKTEDKISAETEIGNKNITIIKEVDNKDGVKVVLFSKGTIKQVVELLYESNLSQWNEEIDQKIEEFNIKLSKINIIKKDCSIFFNKNVDIELNDKDNKGKMKIQDETQNKKDEEKVISFHIINEEFVGKTKPQIQILPCSVCSFELIQTSKEIPIQKSATNNNYDNAPINDNVAANQCNLNKDNSNEIIKNKIEKNNKNSIPETEEKSNISHEPKKQQKTNKFQKQKSLNVKGNPILKEHLISKKNTSSIPNVHGSQDGLRVSTKNNNEINKQTQEQKIKHHNQVLKHKQKEPPKKIIATNDHYLNNTKLSFSLKERIALVNKHFLTGGKGEIEETPKQEQRNQTETNEFTFINPLIEIMKPVTHLKKQKPTYKIFDENYSKSAEIEFETEKSLQKTVEKAKNLRNMLKKKK